MTHIDRLLNTSPNHRTRELLDAGLEDTPPRGSLTRVATGLGVVVGGSTWSAVAAGAGSAASTAAAASGGTLTLLGVGKLLAAGALAGTLVSGAGVAARHLAAPTTDPSARVPHVIVPAELSAPRNVATRARSEAAPASTETPKATSTTTGTQEAPSTAPQTSSPDSGALAAEVARIDAARSALSSGDTERALSELSAYQRERRIGVLDREAALLAIRAHSERGESGRARDLARRYLSAHPDDAHAPQLRELLDEK